MNSKPDFNPQIMELQLRKRRPTRRRPERRELFLVQPRSCIAPLIALSRAGRAVSRQRRQDPTIHSQTLRSENGRYTDPLPV